MAQQTDRNNHSFRAGWFISQRIFSPN